MKKKREANEKSEGRPRERRYFTRCGDRMGTHSLSCFLSLSREEEDELSRSNKKVKDAQYGSFSEDKASGYRDESLSLKLLLKMNLWGLYLGRTIKLLTS